MTGEIMTVDAAANLLQLHPKTVLRFIRDGRLRATKVGKQYRILRSDLNAFAGASKVEPVDSASATCVVDIENVEPVLVERLSAILLGASNRREPSETSVSISMAHDPARRSLKVIIIASPADAVVFLKLIDTCLETRTNERA